MANINDPLSKPSSVLVPTNYPMEPTPGKISLLFNANQKNIYHKLSFDIPMYRYPDNPPSSFKKLGGRGLPLGRGVDDVVRVTKFVASGKGLIFLGKQFLLQGLQPFDETNIYNASEVILSTVSNMTGGILSAPKRHIDKSGGLLGGLAALVGVGVSRGSPPPSTVAAGGSGPGGGFLSGLRGNLLGSSNNREEEVLPVQNYGSGTGLLRAKTANKAKSILQSKWGIDNKSSGGVMGFVKGLAKSMFPQVFGADKQNGIKQRADELAYDLMFKYYNDITANNLAQGKKSSGLSLSFMGIPLNKGKTKSTSVQMTNSLVELFKQKYYFNSEQDSKRYNVDSVFIRGNNEEQSEMKDRFETGYLSEPPASEINDNLKKVIENIKRSGIYTVEHSNVDTWLFSSGNPTKNGYDRLHNIAKTPYNLKNNKNSVESAYYDGNVRTLDSIINPNKNCGFSGNGRPDKINTLVVLDKDKKIKEQLVANYEEYKPYSDDLIAFFFYDVVNEKYIPFRATVKGISESNNALWDELRFLGRADSLYSYTGFTRNLSFSFTVSVNSLIELQPVWQRINYLASSVKPSNYTKRKHNDGSVNRFIIPPMFMLTIGDLYKQQPIIIASVTMTIPDNASWELTPENNNVEWSHMANMIKTKIPITKIGQMPREIEVSVACNVLEKERAVVGGNHYGHAPDKEIEQSDELDIFDDDEIHQFSDNIRATPRGIKK